MMNFAMPDYKPSPLPTAPALSAAPTIPGDFAGLRVDQAIARLYPDFSRSRLQAWIEAGQITIDGARVPCKMRLKGGEQLAFDPPPVAHTDAAPHGEALPLDILHQDREMLIVNKPSGLVVHPGAGRAHGTLLNALLHHDPQLAAIPRAGIVHRLDRETSGLMVVARTLTAHTHLVRQLKARSVGRVYLALVHGTPPASGVIDTPIGRHPTQRTKMAVVARGREARTCFRRLAQFAKAALLECRLDTGRTHQIRVHLASIGFGVIGDPTYGRQANIWRFPRQALHAHALSLLHPHDNQQCSFQCQPPQDFHALRETLRQDTP